MISSPPALLVRNLRKRYHDVVAVGGPRPRGPHRRMLRPARPQRRRQDHHHRDLRGADRRRTRATWRCSGCRWAHDAPRLRQRLGIQLQETQLSEKLTVLETIRLFRSFFHQGPEVSRDHRARAARREAGRARRSALGRAEAAAGRRLRAGGRSGAAVPRRADDRPRSAGAPAALGSDRAVQAGRANDPADDALHGRSRAALRSRRDHGSRPRHRPRHAARADRLDRRRARGGVRGRQRVGDVGRVAIGAARQRPRRARGARHRPAAGRPSCIAPCRRCSTSSAARASR